MKDIVFFDIDTQHNFMRKEGKFYVPDAEKIIPRLKKITDFAEKKKISVIASIDNGYKKIPETRLPSAKLISNKRLSDKKIKKLLENDGFWILKQKHDVFSNPNTKNILKNVKKAYVYGVATDYCVKAAVLGLRNMDIETYVIKDAIKPVFKKNEKKNLALFRKKGAKLLTTTQLLKKNSL